MRAAPKQHRPLSDRQRECLAIIRASLGERGFPPSFREIGALMGMTSTNAVHDHLRTLERKGFIRLTPFVARGITLIGAQ